MSQSFRNGYIHNGLNDAQSIVDFNAVSLNEMYSSMEIADQFYSILNASELKDRIGALGKNRGIEMSSDQETIKHFRQFLEWSNRNK